MTEQEEELLFRLAAEMFPYGCKYRCPDGSLIDSLTYPKHQWKPYWYNEKAVAMCKGAGYVWFEGKWGIIVIENPIKKVQVSQFIFEI